MDDIYSSRSNMSNFLETRYPESYLSQLSEVPLFCHPDINPHTKFYSSETAREGRIVYVHIFFFVACVFVCVYFFLIICLLWLTKLGDQVQFLHRREVAQSDLPVGASFPSVIPYTIYNCLFLSLEPSTALQSVLIPTPFIHLFSPLNLCQIALTHSTGFIPFSQAYLVLQHMSCNFPSCCFSS